MKARHCCQIATRDADTPRRHSSRWRRGGEISGWIIPSVTLVLLPKCPVCVAMYVALFSGMSITVASAATLRTTLVAVSVAVLLGLAMKRMFGFLNKRRASPISR